MNLNFWIVWLLNWLQQLSLKEKHDDAEVRRPHKICSRPMFWCVLFVLTALYLLTADMWERGRWGKINNTSQLSIGGTSGDDFLCLCHSQLGEHSVFLFCPADTMIYMERKQPCAQTDIFMLCCLVSPQPHLSFMRYISVCCVVGIIAGFCIGPGKLPSALF